VARPDRFAILPAQLRGQFRLGAAGRICKPVTITGPFNATGPGDTPSPVGFLFVVRESCAEIPVRASDSFRAGPAGIASGGTGGPRKNHAVLRDWPARMRILKPGVELGCSGFSRVRSLFPGRNAIRRKSHRLRVSRGAKIWNSPRDCRSFCGASIPDDEFYRRGPSKLKNAGVLDAQVHRIDGRSAGACVDGEIRRAGLHSGETSATCCRTRRVSGF